jgi:hypothetical protein
MIDTKLISIPFISPNIEILPSLRRRRKRRSKRANEIRRLKLQAKALKMSLRRFMAQCEDPTAKEWCKNK